MAATWIFIMQSMRTAQATPEKQKLHNTSSYGGIGFLCPLFRGERDCSDIMINGNIFTNNRFGEHIGFNKIWVTDGKTFITMQSLFFDPLLVVWLKKKNWKVYFIKFEKAAEPGIFLGWKFHLALSTIKSRSSSLETDVDDVPSESWRKAYSTFEHLPGPSWTQTFNTGQPLHLFQNVSLGLKTLIFIKYQS